MSRLRQLAYRGANASLIWSLGKLHRLAGSKTTYRLGPDGPAALFEGRWFSYSPRQFGCTGNIDYDLRAENATRAVLFDQVKDGQVFYDIGAHGGVYTLTLQRRFPALVIHSFEPQPDDLIANLELNAVRIDRVHPVALGDSEGTARMTTGERSSNHISERGSRTVPLVRLDDYAARSGLPDPDWIKIDIEGMELPALRGAERMLRRAHPTIICEINHISGRYGTRVADLVDYLKSLGYAINAQQDGNLRLIESSELPPSADFNYWFLPA